ncbi:hypothetical protein ABPG72_012037 [Tetrahymena utriculariae]
MIRMKRFIASAYGISSIEKLTDVVFSFDEFQDLDDEEFNFQDKDITEFIDKFLEAISTNKNLNSLIIDDKRLLFDACIVFKNKNFKHIKEFTLITNDDIFLKQSSHQDIPKFIESLESIVSLKLSFNKTDFPQLLLIHIAQSLGKLNYIKRLSLSFKHSKKFNDEVLKEFCKNFEKLSQLQELHLDLDNSNISNEGFIELGNTISKIKTFRKIFINVQRNPNINEQGSSQYFNHLLSHPNCINFQTQMLFQFEDKELNPNFKPLVQFQDKVKSLTQKLKARYVTKATPNYFNKTFQQSKSFLVPNYQFKLLTPSNVIQKQSLFKIIPQLIKLIKK